MKYGIYYEDNYNYLQHLKDTNEGYELEPVVDRFRVAHNEVCRTYIYVGFRTYNDSGWHMSQEICRTFEGFKTYCDSG